MGVDLAVEAAMRRFGPQALAVVTYHLADPMGGPAPDARSQFYDRQATPGLFVDGVIDVGNGGLRDQAAEIYKDRVVPAIEPALARKPEAAITLQASFDGRAADVDGTVTAPAGTQLQIVLVEELVRFSGSNTVRFHPMVARAIETRAVPAGAVRLPFTHTFDPARISAELSAHVAAAPWGARLLPFERRHAIDATRLQVVAFVQDPKTHRVLQAASAGCPAR